MITTDHSGVDYGVVRALVVDAGDARLGGVTGLAVRPGRDAKRSLVAAR